MITQQEIVNYLQNLIQKIQNGSILLCDFQAIALVLLTTRHPDISNISEYAMARYLSTGWLIDMLNTGSDPQNEPENNLDMQELD